MTHPGDDLFDDPRITAFGLLTEVHNGLLGRLNRQLSRHGIPAQEFTVLIRLARSPERSLRMTDLAAQTSLTTSGVTRLVDRLEAQGLITRRACPTDRRSSYAVLTDKAHTALTAVLAEHVQTIDRYFTTLLPPAELDRFVDDLRTIRAVVNPGATAGAGDVGPLAADCPRAS